MSVGFAIKGVACGIGNKLAVDFLAVAVNVVSLRLSGRIVCENGSYEEVARAVAVPCLSVV